MCAQLIYQRLKDDLKYEVVGDKDKNHYIFTITSKLTGKKTKVAVNYNVGRTIAALSSRLESLRSNKKSLTDGQLTEQSGERNKHNDKIAAEDKTIEGQDKEYDKLLKEKAKEKQVALEVLKKKLNAADVV
jgi:vacuolar-type H+-ATPase subunit I/STV1